MFKELPLSGKKVIVTRAKEQARALSTKIKQYGGVPIEVPLIMFERTEAASIKKIHAKLDTYDWIVFTSVNGIRYFMEDIGIHKEILKKKKIAAVGNKTAAFLKTTGLKADLVPKDFVAEELLLELVEQLRPGNSVLLVKGNLARELLPRMLKEKGIDVTECIVYETKANEEGMKQLREIVASEKIDFITFTSSSTVNSFLLSFPKIDKLFLKEVQLASIGPITSQTLMENGLEVDITANEYTIDGLVEAIIQSLEEEEV